jgi:hypothetical protein
MSEQRRRPAPVALPAAPPRRVTARLDGGTFDFQLADSFTSRYLATFYRNRPPTSDERVVLDFLVRHVGMANRGDSVLEVGCGPTIHHTLPFVPHVSAIDMADYLPENLLEIDSWRREMPQAMDWTAYADLVVRLEDGARGKVEARQRQARSAIRALLPCDLRQTRILGSDVTYPTVSAFYCTEEVGITIPAWQRIMSNLARAVQPGGLLFLAVLRDTDSYLVGDEMYPCARLTEDDVRQTLEGLDFDLDRSVIEAASIDGQQSEGVFGVVLAAARKRG